MENNLSGIGLDILKLFSSMPDETFGQIFLDVEIRRKLDLKQRNVDEYLLNLKTYLISLIVAGLVKLEKNGMSQQDIELANAYTSVCFQDLGIERNVTLERILDKFLITLPDK